MRLILGDDVFTVSSEIRVLNNAVQLSIRVLMISESGMLVLVVRSCSLVALRTILLLPVANSLRRVNLLHSVTNRSIIASVLTRKARLLA